MNIGILSKRTDHLAGVIKETFEERGIKVKIYTADNLNIDNSLLVHDFFVLKSKQMYYLYAGYFLEANNVQVIPNTNISYKCKNRIESHFLIQQANLIRPKTFMGSKNTLINQLKQKDFPLVVKPIMGSGSKGVEMVHSSTELKKFNNEFLYLEQFIIGTHYIAYFIEENICICEKKPLANEHEDTRLVSEDLEIEQVVKKWKQKYKLLFGHLDIVREKDSDKLFVVDPGTFPEFSNWRCDNEIRVRICDSILNRFVKDRK